MEIVRNDSSEIVKRDSLKKEKIDLSKKEKIDLGIGGMDEMMLQQFISSILPKLEPAIKKASGALSEYLGDNEKIIILRQLKKGSDPMVIILNNKKNFNITGENFSADQDSVEQIFNVKEFISKIFSGEFTK